MTRDDSQARWAHRRVGTTVGGKYTLDSVLGVGGMAVVYKATHRNRAEFAVKMLLPELSRQPDLLARFLREGYAANSVKHPGAVRVLDDAIAEDGAAYVVMELLEGVSVERLAEAAGGKLPIDVATGIGVQMLEVLAAAHAAGIVHRDVKPANLFVTREGAVKVLDFGIARVRDMAVGAQATQTGVAMGTPAFMSPEQAMGKLELIDGQSDVWAAGATLFTLMSGQIVHETDSPAELVVRAATRSARSFALAAKEAPIELVSVVDRALAFDKDGRWESAIALREALVDGFRRAFGAAPPGPPELATFVNLALSQAQARSQAQGGSTVSTRARGGTTAAPVATDAVGARVRWRNRRTIAALAGAVAVGAAAVVVAMISGARRARIPPSITAVAPSIVVTSPAPAGSPLELPTPFAPSADHDQVVVAPVPTASAPNTPARPRPVSPLPSVAPASSSHRAPASNCDPDYTLDADGNKHFKPECFLK